MKIYNVGIDSLSEYDLKYLDKEAYEYFIYNYRDFGYDGDGEAVLKDENGKFILIDLGHCSCYGPLEERNPKCIYSLERTDEERQEAFNKLLWHKNIMLRKLDKSSTHG